MARRLTNAVRRPTDSRKASPQVTDFKGFVRLVRVGYGGCSPTRRADTPFRHAEKCDGRSCARDATGRNADGLHRWGERPADEWAALSLFRAGHIPVMGQWFWPLVTSDM